MTEKKKKTMLRPAEVVVQVVSLVSDDDFRTLRGKIVSEPVVFYTGDLDQLRKFVDELSSLEDQEITS